MVKSRVQQKASCSMPISFIRLFWFLQLVAAFAVCVNHFSFALLKGISIPAFWQTQPTLIGIAWLTFSSGFLAHNEQVENPFNPTLIDFIIPRFIRLAVPVYIAVAIDILIFSPHGLNETTSSWWPLLSVATLTQTWSYNIFGLTSLPLPLGPSNLVWFGSCLFGLFLLHGITLKFWIKRTKNQALLLLILCLGFCSLYFNTLDYFSNAIQQWANAQYGVLLAPYQFNNWLILYNPIAELGNYFCGVAFLQYLIKSNWRISNREVVLLLIVSVALISLSSSTFPKYLCIIIIAIVILVKVFSVEIPGFDGASLYADKFYDYITPIAFEIIIFHIMFYSLFPIPLTLVNGSMIVLFGRTVIVNALMTLLLAILFVTFFYPLIEFCLKSLGMPKSSNKHI